MFLSYSMNDLDQMLVNQDSSIKQKDRAQSFIYKEGIVQVLQSILTENFEK